MNELKAIRAKTHSIDKQIRRAISSLRSLVDEDFNLAKTDEEVVSEIDNTCNRLSWIVGREV